MGDLVNLTSQTLWQSNACAKPIESKCVCLGIGPTKRTRDKIDSFITLVWTYQITFLHQFASNGRLEE